MAQIGTINNNGGTVLIGGTLDLTGGSAAYSGFRLDDGTIQGGTIKTDGTGLHYSDFATLSGVTVDGTLGVIGGYGSELNIENGTSFTGPSSG